MPEQDGEQESPKYKRDRELEADSSSVNDLSVILKPG